MKQKINQVKNLIYNEEVQEQLSSILKQVKETNIFEILGIENQEIKHSNILFWLLGNNSHGLGNSFFIEFLKAALKETQSNVRYYDNLKVDIEKYREYIYLIKNDKEYEVKREFQNIDIWVLDTINKYLFVIENKIDSKESNKQLKKYRQLVETQDYQGYEKYFIFLTKESIEPDEGVEDGQQNRENYLLCSYQKIYDIIESFLEANTEGRISLKQETKFILKNYQDLCIRRGIVNNDELKQLCEKIWSKKEYREALNILIENKPNDLADIFDEIIEEDPDIKRLDKQGKYKRAIMTNDLLNNRFILRLNSNIESKQIGFWKNNALVFEVFIEEDGLKWHLYFNGNSIKERSLVEEFLEKIKNVDGISNNKTILSKEDLYTMEYEEDRNDVKKGIEDGLGRIKALAKRIENHLT